MAVRNSRGRICLLLQIVDRVYRQSGNRTDPNAGSARQWRHLGGSRVAMATPDQAVATPESFGPIAGVAKNL